MTTRLKTVEYWFPELAAIADATDTNFTQITVYLPDVRAGGSAFISVFLEVLAQDAEITAINMSRRQVSMQLAASGYTAVNNTNAVTASGEQKWLSMSGDFTALFNTSWTGTSMTCDARVLFDSLTGTVGCRCATAKLTITYEYDDTTATQIKTVWLPLNTPITALATSKPGTANATIQLLDTYLPEATKTFRQRVIVVRGNEEQTGTTDFTVSWEVDTLGVYATGSHEQALATASWFRACQVQSFTTSATHSFYIWASVATCAHLQAWLVVTYEFVIADTTTVMNSLLLPMRFASPSGISSTDFQRAILDLYIMEPTTITIKDSAILFFWEQTAAITGMQYRVGTGSFSGAITSTAAAVAGICGAMFRFETLISLARGKNTLQADVFRTDTTDIVPALTAMWMLNYTSGKATGGVGVHNHTVINAIAVHGTDAVNTMPVTAAVAFPIPETDYHLNVVGVLLQTLSNTTGFPHGAGLTVERLASGEGGLIWELAYSDPGMTDALVGVRIYFAEILKLFKRWPSDADPLRMDIETARRWRVMHGGGAGFWRSIELYVTYHCIIWNIAGTISGSAGGTVNLQLIRDTNNELVKTGSRSGNGSYTLSWYNDTEQMKVAAFEDDTHTGLSKQDIGGS
jgi:hypothetical protein